MSNANAFTNGFSRARAMGAAIAIAMSEFAKNTTELIPALQKISTDKQYQSRGKGGKGRARGKMLGFMHNSVNAQPHEGKREVARRLRGCNPAPIPQRKWYADHFHDFPFKSRSEAMNSPLYKNTPPLSRTPVHLI